MNKFAAAQVFMKLSAYANDPTIPLQNRQFVVELAKQAGLFDSVMDAGSSALSGLGNLGSSAMSGIGNMASSLMPSIGSAIGSMLPPGITWEAVAEKLKAGDPEMASLAASSGVDFVEAVKQAVGQAGVSMQDILSSLGLQ